MVVAYVMVTASTGEAGRLKAEMTAIEGVASASVVAGDVDFIVKVEVDSPEAISDVVVDRIRGIDGVADTQTYIARDEASPRRPPPAAPPRGRRPPDRCTRSPG